LHFTEIWSDRSGRFNLRSKKDKIKFAHDFAMVIHEARPALCSFNISSCIVVPAPKKERAIAIKEVQRQIFAISLLSSLQQLRQRSLAPRWIFDNIKDATSGERTEGWAEEVFLGLQYTPLFTWLSATTPVFKPEFVRPGSHFLLEVADFISYTIARQFEKRVNNEQGKFESDILGIAMYQTVLPNGSVDCEWSNGLPFERFYGNRQS
jgi:hypothetical protein